MPKAAAHAQEQSPAHAMTEALDEHAGTGCELPASLRLRLECFFGGIDLSAVRIHTGPRPAALGALAFARGDQVHIASGLFAPGSPHGQRLLAHELVHVLQQRTGRVPRPDSLHPVVDVPELELEAETLADLFARGHRRAAPALLDALYARAPRDVPITVPGDPGGCHPIQRVVHLELLHPWAGYSALFWCKRIQELLQNEEKVLHYLKKLDQEMRQLYVGKSEKNTPTSKLSKALADTEVRWMGLGIVKILPGQGVVDVHEFLKQYIMQRLALKDIGAGPQHGEYTHRIQWYIIYHYIRGIAGMVGEHYSADRLLHPLYDEMANPRHVSRNIVGVKVSLWDSVLDVRYSWTQGKHERSSNSDLQKIYGDVKYASAPILNDALTKTHGLFIEKCPNLHEALLSRRKKREEQKKKREPQLKSGLEELAKTLVKQTESKLKEQEIKPDTPEAVDVVDDVVSHHTGMLGPKNSSGDPSHRDI